jgi:hypothetical protein
MLFTRWRQVVGVSSVLLLAACQDQLTTPVLPDRAEQASAAAAEQANGRPQEEEMARIARDVPGFGGFHYDREGNVTAYVTDLSQGAAVRAALRPIVQERMAWRGARGAAPPRFTLLHGRYGFLQLATWRDELSTPVLDLPGVESVDLDEAANRIRIGVSNGAVRGAVQSKLAQLGIPGDAAVIELEDTVYPIDPTTPSYEVGSSSCGFAAYTIEDCIRPLTGSIQIGWLVPNQAPGTFSRCTTGFVADMDDGTRVVITNSHCGERLWARDYESYYQNYPGTTGNVRTDLYVGHEYRDPSGSSCGFLSVNKCRNADAMAIWVDPSTGATTNFGYIARTTYANTGSPGSEVIDQANPTFRISSTVYSVRLNDPINKIGVKTGWTRGYVSQTCVDTNTEGYRKYRCQDKARLHLDSGDSGSPVFREVGDGTVVLYGLVWGASDDRQTAYFSSFPQIQKDLGTLRVAIPTYYPPTDPEEPVDPPCEDFRVIC